MKIGVCMFIDDVKRAKEIGADYFEIPAVVLNRMSDDEFSELIEKIKNSSGMLKLRACNALIESDLRLTGEDVDFNKVREYTEKVFTRLDKCGVKKIVFGSGTPKNVPSGFSMDEAWSQLVKCVEIFASEAKKNGQLLLIEPLNRKECNIINTVDEAFRLAKSVNYDNVKILVDYYHFMQNGEKIDDLIPLIPYIGHIHFAEPSTRTYPRRDDGVDYKTFFDLLRNSGYDDTLSFEGWLPDTTEGLKELVDYLKSL